MKVVRAQHQGENQLRSYSSREDVVLLVYRVRQTQTNLLGGKTVLQKKKKKKNNGKKNVTADLTHSSLCSLISALTEDG